MKLIVITVSSRSSEFSELFGREHLFIGKGKSQLVQ